MAHVWAVSVEEFHNGSYNYCLFANEDAATNCFKAQAREIGGYDDTEEWADSEGHTFTECLELGWVFSDGSGNVSLYKEEIHEVYNEECNL